MRPRSLVVESQVIEPSRVDVAVQLAGDAHQEVLVELGGDAGPVVVGGVEYGGVLGDVDADEQAAAGAYRGAHLREEANGRVGLEIAEAGAGEEGNLVGCGQVVGQAELVGEVDADGVDVQPGEVPRQVLGRLVQIVAGDISGT
jgi:hypothetical protein